LIQEFAEQEEWQNTKLELNVQWNVEANSKTLLVLFIAFTFNLAILIAFLVNFGENLPEKPLEDGWEHSRKSDLCLVLGSSLTVSPACSMPKLVAKMKRNLVIVNMQHTPLDDRASLRVYGKCDEFMQLVMKELELAKVPPFYLHRRLIISMTRQNSKKKDHPSTAIGGYVCSMNMQGVDVEGTPVSFLLASELISTVGGGGETQIAHCEVLPSSLDPSPFILVRPSTFMAVLSWEFGQL